MFIYGPPGNGKTTVAETVGRLVLGDDMWIPYAFDVDGQVMRVFDNVNHELADERGASHVGTGVTADPRWVHIKRPMIMVGGELTLAGLDLVYDHDQQILRSAVPGEGQRRHVPDRRLWTPAGAPA